MLGTFASFEAYPTGIKRNGRSFSGRFSILVRKFMGLGVCVNATNPTWCNAVKNIPAAKPTDSVT